MPAYGSGRHERGQNFLTDKRIIHKIVDLVNETTGSIVEIGPGGGALTYPLERLQRPITAVEIDHRLVKALQRRCTNNTHVVCADFLQFRLPNEPHVIVGNLGFNQTTAMLRKLLHSPFWSDAVLLVQWEVARRRAGVGGATMMTAQWWPWFEFCLHGRVSAAAFRPRPSVDGGVLSIHRRNHPLLDQCETIDYKAFVHAIFTGAGRGVGPIARRIAPTSQHAALDRYIRAMNISNVLPKDLSVQHWVKLYELAC